MQATCPVKTKNSTDRYNDVTCCEAAGTILALVVVNAAVNVLRQSMGHGPSAKGHLHRVLIFVAPNGATVGTSKL